MTVVNKTKSLPPSYHKSAYINDFFCMVIYVMKKIKQGYVDRVTVRRWGSQGILRNYHVTRLHRSQSGEDLKEEHSTQNCKCKGLLETQIHCDWNPVVRGSVRHKVK